MATGEAPLSELGAAALNYAVEYGWPLFPGTPRGKQPLIDGGFHMASSHPEQVPVWYGRWPNANICMCPGAIGRIVIDLDGADAELKARELGFLVATLETITARGRHLWFTLPDGITIGNGSPWKKDGIDIRAHMGYVLLPPSVHETGHVYSWRGELDDVQPLPQHVLDALIEHGKQAAGPALGDSGILPIGDGKTAATLREIIAASKRQGIPSETIADALDRRVRRYIEKLGHHGEGSRNSAAFQLSAWLLRDFGASTDTAWAYLSEWNSGNHPPLGARELRQTFRSAARSGRRAIGCAHAQGAA